MSTLADETGVGDRLPACSSQSELDSCPNASPKFKRYLRAAHEDMLQRLALGTSNRHVRGILRFTSFVHVEAHGSQPFPMADIMPARPELIVAFLEHVLETSDNSLSQTRAHRSAISYFHTWGNCTKDENPSCHILVERFMLGIGRRHAKPAKPARCPSPDEVATWFEDDHPTLGAMRILAILAIMVGTGSRLDEVINLTPLHVKLFAHAGGIAGPNVRDGAVLLLMIDKSKTDQFRNGNQRVFTGAALVAPVLRYLRAVGLGENARVDALTAAAPVFRAGQGSKKGFRLLRVASVGGVVENAASISKSTVQADFKALQLRCNPDIIPTTLHANRSFFATTLAADGVPQLQIQKLGDWKSTAFLRYLHSEQTQDADTLQRMHDRVFEM